MSEIIERVARAIAVSDGFDPDKLAKSDPHLVMKSYTQYARAAIEAMRERPTAMSEMIERVAKAKWAHRQDVARAAGIQPPLDDWENELEGLREEVRAEARAAIAAMREPKDDD